MKEVLPMLKGTSDLSLRLVDWFVTNYSKRHNTVYILDGQEFLVYTNYKSQLKAYSKKLFDPFCRRERILFQIPGEEPFLTTVGKLNFFRWALEAGLLTYIEANAETLKTGYNEFLKETTQNQKKLRQEATSANSTLSTSSSLTTVSADTVALPAGGKGTRRRRTKQTTSSLKQLQINTSNYVELSFD